MDDSLMPRSRVIAIGLYLIVLNLLLVYLLLRFWPGKDESVILFPGVLIALPIDTRYLLIVAVAGALGSYIHLTTSFVDFVGNRQFRASWGWWYILRPFTGVALAVILYFLVRGGLVTTTATDTVSPYGVAAIAGMAGMFSKQATDKLREVFENLFQTSNPPHRADKLAPQTEGSPGAVGMAAQNTTPGAAGPQEAAREAAETKADPATAS